MAAHSEIYQWGSRHLGESIMIVLGRKVGDQIAIQLEDGRIVWVTVVRVERGFVRLGVSAPKDIRVDRKEIYDERQETKLASENN